MSTCCYPPFGATLPLRRRVCSNKYNRHSTGACNPRAHSEIETFRKGSLILPQTVPWSTHWLQLVLGKLLFPKHTHPSIATLGSHGGHYFPAVDDRVVTLNATQQRIPIVSKWGKKKQKREVVIPLHTSPAFKVVLSLELVVQLSKGAPATIGQVQVPAPGVGVETAPAVVPHNTLCLLPNGDGVKWILPLAT